MRVTTTTMCTNDAAPMKRWATFGPPDEFDIADTAVVV
jgi:hypothetical protein